MWKMKKRMRMQRSRRWISFGARSVMECFSRPCPFFAEALKGR